MPDASNAILYYEADRTSIAITELVDEGDHLDFRCTADTLWSGAAGFLPVVTPNGVYDGLRITPAASGTNDLIDISAGNVYLAGVKTAVGATTDQALVRPAANDYQKFSITIDSGGSVVVIDGTEHTSFSTTRAATGGPPLITATSVEIGQVWWDSQTPAAVATDEIKQIVGTTEERYDYPQWKVNYSNVSAGSLGYAGITFYSALPLIHTGSVPKDVYASWYTPAFQEIVDAYDFVPPGTTVSVNTTEVYGRVKGGKTQSLGAGSFSAHLTDGVSDNILRQENLNLWFKFYPNRLNDPYHLAQGYMVRTSSFPASGNIEAAFSIAAEAQGDNVYA